MILAAIQLHSKRHDSVPSERIDTDRSSVEALFAKIIYDIMISAFVTFKRLQKDNANNTVLENDTSIVNR